MAESAEGIGGRKWSFEPDGDALYLNQGKHRLAQVLCHRSADAEFLDCFKIQMLLVTAPQLWDVANELCKAARKADMLDGPNVARLAAMVAKAVGKTDWKDVAQ